VGVPPQPPTISFYSSSPLQLSFYSSSRRLICLPVQYKTDRRALNSMGFTALCKNPVQLSGLALNHARKFVSQFSSCMIQRRGGELRYRWGFVNLAAGKKNREPSLAVQCKSKLAVLAKSGSSSDKSTGNRRGKRKTEKSKGKKKDKSGGTIAL
jgi:hypothetical protein